MRLYITHTMLVLLKNDLNNLSNKFFCFFVQKIIFFSLHIMMESLSLQEIIIKKLKNLFRLKKELNYTETKDIRNLFRLEKETETIKDRIL